MVKIYCRQSYTARETTAQRSVVNLNWKLSVALENVRPTVEVKSRRVGGSTYQVPGGEVRPGPYCIQRALDRRSCS